jgi:hypothetical protein
MSPYEQTTTIAACEGDLWAAQASYSYWWGQPSSGILALLLYLRVGGFSGFLHLSGLLSPNCCNNPEAFFLMVMVSYTPGFSRFPYPNTRPIFPLQPSVGLRHKYAEH